MAIKVYGIAPSPAVSRVLACLHEKELEYELIPVNIRAGEHKNEAFLSLNPFGQIPALEDGDLKLFESRAITKHIAYAYADKGTQLIWLDPKKAAIGAVWSEVEAQKFDGAASKLNYEIVVKPFFGQPTDEAVAQEQEEKLAQVLDVYEARLSESKYLAGDDFTLADLHHLPIIHYLMRTRAKAIFDARPHVSKWTAEILARPAWAKVVALHAEALKKSS